MARIALLVGSVYGNAQDVAEYLQELLQAAGHRVALDSEPQLQPLLDEPPDLLLVCTSTTGQGELPDNLLPFFYQLQTQQPSLAGQRVAVVGLGDAAYDETFAMGGKLFEAELLTRQAEPLLELLILDAAAADDPFARSAEWCERLLQRL